jgi:hypothetical protein
MKDSTWCIESGFGSLEACLSSTGRSGGAWRRVAWRGGLCESKLYKIDAGEVNLGKIESGSRYAGIYYVYDLTLESN